MLIGKQWFRFPFGVDAGFRFHAGMVPLRPAGVDDSLFERNLTGSAHSAGSFFFI
jgi:hypothetical protein